MAYPSSTVSKAKNNILDWIYRKEIPENFLLTKNSETGTVRLSNPGTDSIDLVQYNRQVDEIEQCLEPDIDIADEIKANAMSKFDQL